MMKVVLPSTKCRIASARSAVVCASRPVVAENTDQDIYVSEALPQTKRVMVKDEDLCVHCGLCAERCPTAAWDMRRFELYIPYAGQPWPTTLSTAPTTSL